MEKSIRALNVNNEKVYDHNASSVNIRALIGFFINSNGKRRHIVLFLTVV